ncbi:hypothetical protein FQA39_LY17372 [Lamprigera yunnana]|nr:hypothetical protein FQA39_LY17372 [Lamprigera yunnana]
MKVEFLLDFQTIQLFVRFKTMKAAHEEFITKFYSLSGVTVGDKKRSLFSLLNTLNKDEFIDFNFSNLPTSTPLEQKLKLDVIIYFQRTEELVEMLKSEDPRCINHIMKLHGWFFNYFIENISVHQLVENFFPSVSFNVKVKLLNKLSTVLFDSKQADDMFNKIKDIYGINLALKLLPACSFGMIMQYLDEKKLKLPPKQLLFVIQKYPDRRKKLLESLDNFEIERQCNNVVEYLVEHDVSSFIELHEKYHLNRKLGWRSTAKFILDHKEEVIEDPNKFYKILHKKQISKSVGNDFGKLFKNLFPNKLEDYLNVRKSIAFKLNYLSSRMSGVDLYLSTFHTVYGTEIWNHSEFVTMELLKMLSPQERQLRLKDSYKPSYVSEDEWKCLYKIEISVPFLKKQISLTSDIKSRAELVCYLVDTCKINEDKVALSDVCKYMLTKHSNDNIMVRLTFLRRIQENFVFENLEEEHWVYINKLIDIFEMNQESFYSESVFLEGYIFYRLKKDLPIEEELIKYIRKVKRNFNIIKTVPAFEKLCLYKFGELIFKESEDYHIYVQFLCSLQDFNYRHKNDEISYFDYPKALAVLKDNINSYTFLQELEKVVYHMVRNGNVQQKYEFIQLLLEFTGFYTNKGSLEYLLRNEPLIIQENIIKVVHNILGRKMRSNVFFRYCQYYHHLNILKSIIDICVEVCETKVDDFRHIQKVQNASNALSFLMPCEDFLELCNKYLPEENRACSDKYKFRMQRSICLNIRNVKPLSNVLKTLFGFCKGDYFKFILRSIYPICSNLNEDRVVTVLNNLSHRAVSIQKHYLHLTSCYLNCTFLNSAIKFFMEIKKNASLHKFMLKVLFKFFSRNADSHTWDLVKICVKDLDPNDTDGLDLFLQVNKIPKEFLTRYQIFAWELLYNMSNPKGKLDNKRALILDSVDEEGIQLLPSNFCENIINVLLFRWDDVDLLQASLHSFTCKYIIYCKNRNEQEERLKNTFGILTYYIKNKWKNMEYGYDARVCCTKFLQTFCSEFLSDHSPEKNILQSFFELWNNLMKPHEAFGDYLYLKYTLMYLNKSSLQQFTKDFLIFCSYLTQIYGLVVVEILCNSFKQFLVYFLRTEGNNNEARYKFIQKLIHHSESETGLLIAILLLDQNVSEEHKKEIVKMLQNSTKYTTCVTNLYLNRYIRGTTSLDYY